MKSRRPSAETVSATEPVSSLRPTSACCPRFSSSALTASRALGISARSEGYTSELHSREPLVCRLLLDRLHRARAMLASPTRRSSDLMGGKGRQLVFGPMHAIDEIAAALGGNGERDRACLLVAADIGLLPALFEFGLDGIQSLGDLGEIGRVHVRTPLT